MSVVKATKHQVGISSTPADNFIFDASADDGTMVLKRESGQEVMRVSTAGKVTFPQNAQVWTDVTAQRAAGVTYTNTSGLPITLNIHAHNTVTGGVHVTVQGQTFLIAALIAGIQAAGSVTIPDGATYSATGWTTLHQWMELR